MCLYGLRYNAQQRKLFRIPGNGICYIASSHQASRVNIALHKGISPVTGEDETDKGAGTLGLGSAKQLRIQRLVIASMSSYWAWIQSLFFNSAFSSNASEATLVFLCNIGAHFIGLALLAICSKRFAPYIERRLLTVGSTVIVCIASVAVHIGSHMGIFPAEIFGSVFAGIGSAVFLVVWGEAYAHIPSFNTRKTTISIAVVAAFALFIVIASLPEMLMCGKVTQ